MVHDAGRAERRADPHGRGRLMDCITITYSGHALRRLFERGLAPETVRRAIEAGEIIADYPEDQPHPSVLLLGFVEGTPLHVVLARTPEGACIVITAYRPDPLLWSDDFRTRRTRP